MISTTIWVQLNAKSSPVFLRNVKYVLGQSIIYYFRLMSSNKLTVQAGMKHITFQYNCSCFNSCFYNAHQWKDDDYYIGWTHPEKRKTRYGSILNTCSMSLVLVVAYVVLLIYYCTKTRKLSISFNSHHFNWLCSSTFVGWIVKQYNMFVG